MLVSPHPIAAAAPDTKDTMQHATPLPGLPPTERPHPASTRLDAMSTLEIVQLMNHEDAVAVEQVGAVLPVLAELVDTAAARVRRGGRIHYFGAGTSGRLAVLDAAELLPTFDVGPELVVAHIAGGPAAFLQAVEDSEDSTDDGAVAAAGLTADDVAIGLTASGGTPYVLAALRTARARGAHTALITSNPAAAARDQVDTFLGIDTGPEVLTGSTRLKAGTAEKIVLNGFSTALMTRLGYVWSNLMVSMVATNDKLRDRTLRILAEATGLPHDACARLLVACDGELKVALVAALGPTEPRAARQALGESHGSVHDALDLVRTTPVALPGPSRTTPTAPSTEERPQP